MKPAHSAQPEALRILTQNSLQAHPGYEDLRFSTVLCFGESAGKSHIPFQNLCPYILLLLPLLFRL